MRVATVACVLALAAAGCAPAFPTFAGATTTPERRGDLLLGASYRVPVAPGLERASSPDEATHTLETFAAREGAVPAVAARYGVGRHLDVGVVASGTAASLDLRYAAPLGASEAVHLVVAARGLGGWTTGDGVSGALGGVDVPVLLTYTVSGIYDVWLGAHVAGLAGAGDVNGQHADAAGLRLGGIVGLAIGFQSFAAMVELAADYESWLGHAQGGGAPTSVSRDGFVLTPSLGIRLRI